MKTILITGANRGIGLEFTQQYAKTNDYRIFACCRQPDQADKLNELAKQYDTIQVMKLDITHADDIQQCVETLNNHGLDILINNAGISGKGGINNNGIDADNILDTIRVNALAPLTLTDALLPAIRQSQDKTIVNITSKMGSIGDNTSGGRYAYRTSKTALNMLSRSLAVDLKPEGIKVAIIHPGWVQTDMGGPNALITTEESVTHMRRLIGTIDLEQSGEFFSYDGKTISW